MKTMADMLRERGKLGPYTTVEERAEIQVDGPVGEHVEASTVREWAARNGVECPPRGRVPRVVLDAYREAH